MDGEGVGTIRDDDVEEPPPGQPTLRIDDVTVDEDDGPAEFTVTLSEASGRRRDGGVCDSRTGRHMRVRTTRLRARR